MPTPNTLFWQRLLMPFRLLYALIWQPSQIAQVPLVAGAFLLLLCSLPLVVGLAAAGGAIGWFVIVLACCVAAGLAVVGLPKEGVALLLIAGLLRLRVRRALRQALAKHFALPAAGN